MKVELITHDGKCTRLQSANAEALVRMIEDLNVDKSVATPFAEVEIVADDGNKVDLESLDVNELVHMIRLLSGTA